VVAERSRHPVLVLRVHWERRVVVHWLGSHVLVWVEAADGYDIGQ
jgi:hypothetical protein